MPIHINSETGLIENVSYLESPHCDARPAGTAIDLIVVHCISLPPGEFGSNNITDFFLGRLNPDAHPYFATIAHMRVSSHVLIRRTGEILQFVPFNKRAWHAGESNYKGRTRCNDFSIGIELEGLDTMSYEEIQYQKLADLIYNLRQAYPAITRDRIASHSEIAPERKTDPGPGFSWDHLQRLLFQKEHL